MIKQLSIFMENKKGTMQQMLSLLSEADIAIYSFVTNDSAEYGIVRMVVSDSAKAQAMLQDAGYLCKTTDVIGVLLEEHSSQLFRLLQTVADMNVNVDYSYYCYDRRKNSPVALLHCETMEIVELALQQRGYTLFAFERGN